MMGRAALAAAVFLGFMLDLLIGDPHFLYHPVRLIGWMITKTEGLIRRFCREKEEKLLAGGVFLVLVVTGGTLFVSWGLLNLFSRFSETAGFFLAVIFCWQLLAVKSLRVESMKVYRELQNGDLAGAKTAVSMIVGRDTERLSEEQVAKAAVETVAENTSDGVIAPLFYIAIGGPVLGFFYKAVNTMDSMVGYKNERYLYFGRAAAKLDDVLNYIPARLSAWLMILVSFLLGMDWKNALRIYRRDRYNHASPNSAHTEAVCAGALGLKLAGDAWYFGRLCRKKTIGDETRRAEPEDIRRACRLLYGTAALAVIFVCMLEMVF